MEKPSTVLSKEEIQRFVDLGLGRGVDLTDPRPWANKGSFQVRLPNAANLSDIIGTDEGGLLQSYESRICSSEDAQAQVKAGLSVPHTPVSLGIQAETSRSSNSSKKVKTTTAINRTISFRMDSISVPEPSPKETPQEQKSGESGQPSPSFEENLSRWIWKQMCHRNTNKKPQELAEKSAISLLADYMQNSSKDEVTMIVEDCSDFVNSFGVTHYVSSITLGASEHAVESKSKRTRTVKQGSSVSVPMIASAEESSSVKSKFSKSTSRTQYLGKIVDKRVERGSSNEAVVDVKILPIYSLISNNQFVYLALYKAIADYIEDRTLQQAGPYVMECGDEGMYWKVDADHTLTITRNFKQASVFHVIPCDDTDDEDDFNLGWKGETLQSVIDEECSLSQDKTCKIMRYLEVKTFFFEHHPGPLKFKSTLTNKDARLCLYDQIVGGYFGGLFASPAPDIEPWTEKNQVFFISSANRKSFIAVERSRNTEQADPENEDAYKYTTRCVGSQIFHNEKDAWMLFRLLPTEEQTEKTSMAEKSKKRLCDQLDGFFK